jgi:FKBP-type peptidyl-prolyl cis-trans isomerase SlyD
LILEHGKVGVLHYVLRDAAGKTLESSHGGGPMPYLHGFGNLVPGLERALAGQERGAHLEVALAPADAYGERKGPGPQRVRRRDLPKELDIVPGRPFRTTGSDGRDVILWILKAEGAWVTLDVDHPLAGQPLTFDVDVLFVREATEEELQHGHAHGVFGEHSHG